MFQPKIPTSDKLLRFTRGDTAYHEIKNREIALKRGDAVVAVLVMLVLITFEPNTKKLILASPVGKFFRQVPAPAFTAKQKPVTLPAREATTPKAKTHPIKPYRIETPYFIDNSPSGAYDFTLIQNGSRYPAIPAPCSGTIGSIYFQGRSGGLKSGKGAGQIVTLKCDGKSYGWLLGHLQLKPPVKRNQRVTKGQTIGYQGITGRTSGPHVHAQIHTQSGWRRITNRRKTMPVVKDYLAFLRKEK